MSNTRKPVLRTCVVTREQLPQKELLRVVRNNTGLVFVDVNGKQNGRGAYIKKDPKVIEQARKTKALDRALQTEVPEEVYTQMENAIKKNELD